MNDKFEKLIRETVIGALAEKGSDVVADMANDILSKKVDPRTGREEESVFSMMYMGFDREKVEKISYLEYLARKEVTETIAQSVTGWFADRKATLKQQIIDRIDAEAIADSYMAELTSMFESGRFGVDIDVTRHDPDNCD